MPFDRPTPQQIRDRLAAEIEAALPGADARTRRSVEGVLVRAMSVASYSLHEHLDWVSNQILPDTAEAEILERHASLWGIQRRSATPAVGTVRFTGLAGTLIPAGSLLRRTDDVRYVTVADATIGTTTVDVAVTASVAGAAGNTPTGTKVTLVAPIAGIQSQALVIADISGGGLTTGADIESDDDLRTRVITRMQKPPQGGADYDYLAWAQDVAGVAVGKVWVYPGWQGLGSVGLAFLIKAGAGYAIPSAADVAAVQAHINAVRPVTAQVYAFAPAVYPVALTIRLSPDTPTTRAAVLAELADFFTREAQPGGVLYLSRLRAAISVAVGEDHHELLAPIASIVPPAAQLPQLGVVTWDVGP
jgi:uncharacterized phage protein gp47/JayE